MNTPWMLAIETQHEALVIVNALLASSDRNIVALKSWNVDRVLLERATAYAWSAEVTDVVLQASRTIPLDTPIAPWNLESEVAWWYFERPLPFKTIIQSNLVRALCFGWIPTIEKDFGMPVCAWVDEDAVKYRQNISPSQTFEWEKGITLGRMLDLTRESHRARYGPGGFDRNEPTIGEDAFMEATEGIARFVLAGLAWLGQSILMTAEGHVERHRRKAFAKVSGHHVPAVKVVHLRRASYTQTPTEGGEPVNWSCRWVVGGHWRNQARGLKHAERKLTYILPYVKGPDDKPFKATAPKVFVVDRKE